MSKIIDNTNLGYLISKIKAAFWPKSDVIQIGLDNTPTANSDNLVKSGGVKSALDTKQDTLVSGTNIKTINNESLLGSGNISITGGSGGEANVIEAITFNGTPATITNKTAAIAATIPAAVTESTVSAWGFTKNTGTLTTETDPTVPAWAKAANKPTYTASEVGAQEVLVSGTNIKTINNQSLLGSGDLIVPIKIYEFQTTDFSAAYYGYITISWDTYQSIISDFNNGISVAIRTKYLSNDEIAAEYEWHLEQQIDESFVFFRFAPDEYCRIFIYSPSTPGVDPGISAGPLSFSNMERVSNRVTSVSAASNNSTYPTAKATYDATISSVKNIASGSQVSGWNDIVSGNYSVSVTVFNTIVSAYKNDTLYGYYFRNSSILKNITFKVLFVLVGYENESLIFSITNNGHLYTITWKNVNNEIVKTFTDINVSDLQNTLNTKQDLLVSGTNIKTINNQSLLGSGNVSVGTITGITMNGASKGTSGVVDLGTVLTSETALSKGTTTGSGNAVTDISVSGHQITLTKGSTFLTSETSLSKGTTTGSGNAVTDVSVNGHQITLTKGTTFLTSHQDISGKANLSGAAFTGAVTGTSSGNTAQFRNITISSSEPTSSQGSNGDIWIVV